MPHAQGLKLLTLPACTVKFKSLKMGNVGLRGYANPTWRSSTSPLTSLGVCPDFSSGSILDLVSMISKMELTALLTFVRSVDLLVDRETARALMVIAKNTLKTSPKVVLFSFTKIAPTQKAKALQAYWTKLENAKPVPLMYPCLIPLFNGILHFSSYNCTTVSSAQNDATVRILETASPATRLASWYSTCSAFYDDGNDDD
jgi:hypothetical protein